MNSKSDRYKNEAPRIFFHFSIIDAKWTPKKKMKRSESIVIKIILLITIFHTLTIGVSSKLASSRMKTRRRNAGKLFFSKWRQNNSAKDLDTSASNQVSSIVNASTNFDSVPSKPTPPSGGIGIGERPVLQPVFIPM